MTEMQKTLKTLEQTLCKFQVSGGAAILMGDALRLLIQAQAIAKAEEEGQKEAADGQDH